MSGPKAITKQKVAELASKAARQVETSSLIKGYVDLYPIFDEFDCRHECFDFLVSEGILMKRQRTSFEQYWYKRQRALNKEAAEENFGEE